MTEAPRRHYGIVALGLLTFFVASFLTNIIGPLVPDIIESFALNLTMVAVLPFAFFLAYGVMSVPAGMLVEAWGAKRVMLASFALAFAGALGFAAWPGYAVAIVSLFAIGGGTASLQVALHPLLRTAGGEEHFAFNSVLGQFAFGAASFLSPKLYQWIVQGFEAGSPGPLLQLLARLVPEALPWVALYWVFAAVCLAMLLVVALARFPVVVTADEERVGSWATHRALFARPLVWLYALGIFAYVGTEQGVANWTSQFLYSYHGVDPQLGGADAVSLFWGLMTLGCLLGLVLLKFVDSRRLLIGAAAAAMLSLSLGLFGGAQLALWALPAVGFFASVMWSIVFSLALNSVAEHHGSFSGILCSAVIGGAVVPLVVAHFGDLYGLRLGLCVLYLPLGYLLSIGFWSRPLIGNARL